MNNKNTDKNKEKTNNPHKNHRYRLKKLFLKEGLGSFADHNVLELLLFYCIPQKDTNEIAHALLDKFGSISAVFDAKFEDLCNVSGISEHSATLIKLIPQLSSKYSLDKISSKTDFSNLDNAAKYLVEYFMPKTRECVVLILVDNKGEAIHISEISEGIVNLTQVDIRKIAELAFLHNASGFILSHNHPNGRAKASKQDINFTLNLLHTFDTLGVRMQEHILVAGKNYKFILEELSRLEWQ